MTQYIHLGQNYRGIDGRIIRPYDVVRFCHLRDANFRGVDLTGVEFLGCRFNGASFIDANLTDTKFIGCFIGDDYDPMYLEEETASRASFIDCYLAYSAMLGSTSKPCDWDTPVVKAASKLLSSDNGTRNDGVKALQKLDDPIVAPFLASCLIDEEWDVVSLSLEALMKLRGESFPHHDREILAWMFFCLGHENSVVRYNTAEIVRQLKPDDDMLIPVVAQVKSIKPAEQLAGLLAARELYYIEATYIRFLNMAEVEPLIHSSNDEVRAESMRWLVTFEELKELAENID
jgi:hypothetical protein